MTKYCHEFPVREGDEPEECFEGTPCAEDCVRLSRVQYWDECSYGCMWRGKAGD